MNKNIFRPGYEKPLHYPCTLLMKAKPGCSYDKRLYCDIFSLYYKCEKEWDIGDLKDKIEWWCYATDLERYIKQLQKDLDFFIKEQVRTQTALIERTKELDKCQKDLEQSEKCCSAWQTQALDYKAETIALSGKLEIARKALKDIKTVCDNCRWCESNIYTPDSHDGRIIAETTNKALEQTKPKE